MLTSKRSYVQSLSAQPVAGAALRSCSHQLVQLSANMGLCKGSLSKNMCIIVVCGLGGLNFLICYANELRMHDGMGVPRMHDGMGVHASQQTLPLKGIQTDACKLTIVTSLQL